MGAGTDVKAVHQADPREAAQCSQPSSPSVFGGGRDGLRLIVRLFGGARTDYAREGEDRTDYRGL